MMLLVLMPRELEAIQREARGVNAHLVEKIQRRIDGDELELSLDDVLEIRAAARNWRGGSENQLRTLVSAIDRH